MIPSLARLSQSRSLIRHNAKCRRLPARWSHRYDRYIFFPDDIFLVVVEEGLVYRCSRRASIDHIDVVTVVPPRQAG
jgi:hypothetical protein